MTLYQVSIQKANSGTYWTNRYNVDAIDIQAAETKGLQIVEAERNAEAVYVEFISMRTSLAGPENPSVYLITPLQGYGERAVTTVLPLTVVTRVLLISGPGRPDAKFYRGMAQASDIYGTTAWTPTYVNFIETNVGASLMGVGGLVDGQGNDITSVQCSAKISQHQLTRGTRKRTQPIIPVA